jgi:hypothetical protein
MIRFMFPLSHPRSAEPHHRFYKDMGGKKNRMGVRVTGFSGNVRLDLVFSDGDGVGLRLLRENGRPFRGTPLRVYIDGKMVDPRKDIPAEKLARGCEIRIEQVSRSNQGRKYCLRCTSSDGSRVARSPPVLVMSKVKKRRPPSIGDVDRLCRKMRRLENQNEALQKENRRLCSENMRLRASSEDTETRMKDPAAFGKSCPRTDSLSMLAGLEREDDDLLLYSIAGYFNDANIHPDEL